MPEVGSMVAGAFALSELASLRGLWLGKRMIQQPWLKQFGAKSHASKMKALATKWPLTLIRPAVRRGDVGTVTLIVTLLVVLKSLGSMIFGLLTVFWLPIASLTVPSVIAAEDPGDPELLAWAQGVARLQVTSHVIAAALGFAVTVAGPLAGIHVFQVLRENVEVSVVALVLSLVFAVAAGRREAQGIVKRGV